MTPDFTVPELPPVPTSLDIGTPAWSSWIALLSARNYALAQIKADEDRADQRSQRAAQSAAMQTHATEMGKVSANDLERMRTATLHSQVVAIMGVAEAHVGNGVAPALALTRAWDAWDKAAAEAQRRMAAGKL